MRINIPTGRKKIKDPDILALYILEYALKMSTDKMVKANVEFAISKYYSDRNKKLNSEQNPEPSVATDAPQ